MTVFFYEYRHHSYLPNSVKFYIMTLRFMTKYKVGHTKILQNDQVLMIILFTTFRDIEITLRV